MSDSPEAQAHSSKPVLYIHAGSHKTGTTAIQQILGPATAELRQQGICWPVLGSSPTHHKLVRAIYGEGLLSKLQAAHLVRRIRRQARGCRATVISSEKIYRVGYEFFEGREQYTQENRERRVAFLRNLRAYFAGDFTIRVILYLRPVDDFAESMFKELLFRKPYTGRFLFDDFIKEQHALFRYRDQLDELEEWLGPVEVHSYNASRKAGLIEHFCSVVGATPPANLRPGKKIRQSASNLGALFLLRFARDHDLSPADRRKVLGFCLSDAWPEPPDSRRSLWPDRAALSSFLDTYRDAALEDVLPPQDSSRLEFGPIADRDYELCRDAFEKWSRHGSARRS